MIQSLTSEETFKTLHSRPSGLNEDEIMERLHEVGYNTLEIEDKNKWLRSLIKQFTNFFTILLILSGTICFIAESLQPGESMDILGYTLMAVSVLNALFSFFQEYKAEKAMEELKKFIPSQVIVLRKGQEITVPSREIVPGDVLIIREGDKIPADARLITSHDLTVNIAPLTGESNPITLHSEPSKNEFLESNNIVFAGCTVLKGNGEAVIFATGLRTEFGKIAHLSQSITRNTSPLERETRHMVRILTVIAVSMGVLFFTYGVITGRSIWINLVFMMGIIVANVPEGLLPTYTLALAMGSLRMAKRNVLVKSLNAVEALGAVHAICTDKTGTLTLNQLTLVNISDPLTGESIPQNNVVLKCVESGITASDIRIAETLIGDPLDVALGNYLVAAGNNLEDVIDSTTKHFAFDLEKRRASGISFKNNIYEFSVKGAWESIRPLLSNVYSHNEKIPVTENVLKEIDATVHKLASKGLRVIALATKALSQENANLENPEPLENGLELKCFFGIEDPLRDEVPEAVTLCHNAGIEVYLITGDHPDTALAIARKGKIVSLDSTAQAVITGDHLQKMKEEQLVQAIAGGVRIFARSTPEQKMKIISALKTMNKVVAMTGDGVNDAPALKAADVGIAMGKGGTDVARESSHIILLDDNFASIVQGIQEGRTVFGNIKKFTNYVLVSNGPEIIPYLLYILFPVPLGLTIIQILSIDLGTDIIPSIGLGQEPSDAEEMNKPPRDKNEALLSAPIMIHSYLFLGIIEGGWSVFMFFYVLLQGGWEYGQVLAENDPLLVSARGIALATILLMQVGNLIGRRFAYKSGLDSGIFKNPYILAGIIIQFVFSWALLYYPPVQKILGTGPVDFQVYLLGWAGIPLIFFIDLLRKSISKHLQR